MLSLKLLALLVLVFFTCTCGTLIFIKGFLLSRTVVNDKSLCDADFASPVDDHSHHGFDGCWMHGRFKRAVIIIIDALKYEFTEFDTKFTKNMNVPPYKNKLTSIHDLLQKRPFNSRLYKFLADAPTTTMQRIKGLTTGSLPTFVDAGTNFQSYEIKEDNIIDQIISAEKKIKFLGDDTWLGLFPKRFYKAFDFPSFNVKDLHTVDNGILQHIYPEMRRSDWDVLIAHFLGVDHCGHKFGPDHPAMAHKLTQMDAVLRNVTELLRDDTILFVMGDHGMTRTGDHGGESDDELEAALFVYSPARLFSDAEQKESNIVKQTDFVPTISLLLGVPIPFSNLGMVIPELFSHCPWWDTQTNDVRRLYHTVKALRLNALQLDRYLTAYNKVSSDMSPRKLNQLRQLLSTSENTLQGLLTSMIVDGTSKETVQQFISVQKMFISYIQDARAMCEGIWAKFNLTLILLGLLTILMGILLCTHFLFIWKTVEEDKFPLSSKVIIGLSILHIVYAVVHISFLPETVPPVMGFVLAAFIIVSIIIQLNRCDQFEHSIKQNITISNAVASVLVVLYCLLFFSNSFVVYENTISVFFLQTLKCAFGAQIIYQKASAKKFLQKSEFPRPLKKSKSPVDIVKHLSHPHLVVTYLLLGAGTILRLSTNFWVCREEQVNCENSIFIPPLSNFGTNEKNQRYIFSIACVGGMVLAVRFWLRFYGNLNGRVPGVLAMRYMPPTAALLLALHWAIQAVPEAVLEAIPPWQQVLMARAVYVCLGLALVTILAWPLLLYVLLTRTNSSLQLPHQSKHAIPTLYNQLKISLGQSGKEEKPPMVYGLGSVYSASTVTLLCVVSLLLVLLLDNGQAPSLLLATLLLYCLMELYSAATLASFPVDKHNEVPHPSWSGVVMISFLANVFFFSTGHQASIPSIRFEAAYTGFYGDFNSIVLPGFLIWMNTFAGPVLFTLASPLLVFWPALSSSLVRWMVSSAVIQTTAWQGDFKLFNDAMRLRKDLFKVSCSTIFIAALKMLSAATAAAIHRRHLMVWKIFAPRFVYEAAIFVTTSVCAILAYLFVLRVDCALSTFVKKLPEKKDN